MNFWKLLGIKKAEKPVLPKKNFYENEAFANDFGQCIERVEGFSRINWPKAAGILKNNNDFAEHSDIWNSILRLWLNKLKLELGEEYQLGESENFILLSVASDSYVSLLLAFLERSHSQILLSLDSIARTNSEGKFAVILFDNLDAYYAYIAHYYPSGGEFAMSSGVFINDGYGHFVLPYEELTVVESVVAHELTHAMLSHLPIPLWLNEGLAVNMEAAITGYSSFRLNKEKHLKHQRFWGESEIQQFWSGTSFQRTDEGNELSYQLAQLIVLSLAEDKDRFRAFCNHAHYDDGGDAAAIKDYGGSIGAVIAQYFGEGD